MIEGFDWGPAVSKIILSMATTVSSTDFNDYTVSANRAMENTELSIKEASGSRTVVYSYVSDANGDKLSTGDYVTLVLTVAPNSVITSPIKYLRENNQGSNHWVDYGLTITQKSTNRVWDSEVNRIIPLIDNFDLTGKFVYDQDLTMSYAAYTPIANNEKAPLIIWLHGGGEGGVDPSIPLIANRAANYASEEIQAIFGGAYVLVPQCPSFWMQNKEGAYTLGRENDVYNEGLMAFIKVFVSNNPNIDTNRIYIGGCSNGGYMSLKLIMLYPDYFAAGFISALAFQSQYISDAQIQQIKDVPIWFVHSKDDPITIADKTVVPMYKRLIAAGAPDVHFSYYDHVVDITGFFGGSNYHYNGHWSWIYSHANRCTLDVDGTPVTLNGQPVTIMEWMASKNK